MKNILSFLLTTFFLSNIYAQTNTANLSTDSVNLSSKVEFFMFDGPYGEKKNLKKPAIRFVVTIKNIGTKPIPNLGVTNRSLYLNLYINDSINNPVSLYNGAELLGDYLLKKGASDTYTWWVFEEDAYSNTFTVQWKYLNRFSQKHRINVRKKSIKMVK